jgi:LacI family gluconate utilization system Gnt-I transcriptional repressor
MTTLPNRAANPPAINAADLRRMWHWRSTIIDNARILCFIKKGILLVAEIKMKSRSRRGSGKPRIEDIAARAGVGSITVSRVFRSPELVSPEKRARVMEAVEALGYIPNLAASELASKRSNVVALILPTIANSVFAATAQGFTDTVNAAGLQLLLGQSAYSPETEFALISALVARQPEALGLVGIVRHSATRQLLQRAGLPVAEMWDMTSDPLDVVIGFSNYEAARAMTRFLIGKGYRQIAFITSTSDPYSNNYRGTERRKGYRDEMKKARLPVPELVVTDNVSYGAGRQALRELLKKTPRTEAIFFSNDILAVGALIECMQQGIEVPGRIAIAGFGDLEIASEIIPTLTTVRIPSYEIGHLAAQVLLARASGEAVSSPIVDLGFTIVERKST